MAHHAENLGRIAAAAAFVVAAGSAGSALAAGDDLPAPGPAESATVRPVMVRAVVAGGLRNGLVMQITPGHTEIISVPAPTPRVASAAAMRSGTDSCSH